MDVRQNTTRHRRAEVPMSGNVLQLDQREAKALSRELREDDGPYLRRRRGVVGLSLLAAGSMAVITLYQMGIIKHLPEPPLPRLEADRVDASPEAYRKLEAPDAVLGLGSYAATVTLAAMGGKDRAQDQPWLPLAMAGKVGFDSVQALKLTLDQWTKHRTFCSWCLLAAGATLATLPLVVPEAKAALRRLKNSDPSRPDGN